MSSALKLKTPIHNEVGSNEEGVYPEDNILTLKKPSKKTKSSFQEDIEQLKQNRKFGDKFQRTEENISNKQEEEGEKEELSPLLSIKKENSIVEEKEESSPVLSLKLKKNEKDLEKELEKDLKSNIDETTDKEDSSASKKRSNIFYKVNNHQELFKVGSSFMSDFESGINSFAVSSTGYQTSQQKMILGLASFFDHKENIKIAIVTDNLYDGLYQDIVKSSRQETLNYDEDMANCKVYIFHNHFEFVCLDSLLEQDHQNEEINYEERIEEFKSHYDLVFWDVPELHKIQMNPEIYYPMIMNFDCLSIIVAQALSKKEDIEELRSFFSGYGINLKGLIVDKNSKEKEKIKQASSTKVKKPWWRFFK